MEDPLSTDFPWQLIAAGIKHLLQCKKIIRILYNTEFWHSSTTMQHL